eukprot:549487-Pleurochrysis_carterae.AAC.1
MRSAVRTSGHLAVDLSPVELQPVHAAFNHASRQCKLSEEQQEPTPLGWRIGRLRRLPSEQGGGHAYAVACET